MKNTKIHELKINNYKRKILEEYNFLDCQEILHGDELSFFFNFYKETSVNSNTIRKSFPFYKNNDKIELEYKEQYKLGLNYSKINLKNIFRMEDKIFFYLVFNDEVFCLGLKFSLLFHYFDKVIKTMTNKELIISTKNYNKLLALGESEYEWEVFYGE